MPPISYVVHCVLSPWGEWSDCSQTCAISNDVSLTEKTRYRHVVQEGAHGGVKCPESFTEVQPCTICQKGKKPEPEMQCIPRCPSKKSQSKNPFHSVAIWDNFRHLKQQLD